MSMLVKHIAVIVEKTSCMNSIFYLEKVCCRDRSFAMSTEGMSVSASLVEDTKNKSWSYLDE